MAAANPAQRTATVLPPYYRRYELPWSPSEETERRFRTILRNLAIVFAIFAVLMPFLPRHERTVNTESLPERVVQLVIEPPPPPPPPPPPNAEVTPFAVAITDVATSTPLEFLAPCTTAVSPRRRPPFGDLAVRVNVVAEVSLTLTSAPVEDVR
jgi:hypothetical protein